MNIARVLFDPELLLRLARGRYEIVENALPAGTQLRGVTYDCERGAVSLMVEHPSFPIVPAGGILPILSTPIVRALITDQKILAALLAELQMRTDRADYIRPLPYDVLLEDAGWLLAHGVLGKMDTSGILPGVKTHISDELLADDIQRQFEQDGWPVDTDNDCAP